MLSQKPVKVLRTLKMLTYFSRRKGCLAGISTPSLLPTSSSKVAWSF